MSLDSIVAIQISTETAAVTQAGFGVPLILGAHTHNTDRIRFYTGLDGMVADGFLTTEPEYKIATRMFSQNPRPERIAIGRRENRPTPVWKITPSGANNATYKVRVGALIASFTSDASATVAEITAGLAAAITALGVSGVTATDATTYAQIATAIGGWVGVEPLTSNLSVVQDYAAANPAGDLDAIKLVNNTWYGIATPYLSASELTAIAAWTEANGKLFAADTQDTPVKASTTGHVGATLKASAYARTFAAFHPAGDGFFGAGLLGACLPLDPGSETWKFKTVAGLPVVAMTETEIGNLKTNSVNYFYTVAGRNISAEGVVAAGEYIDVIRGRDWLQARLQERIFQRLANAKKIPFTDAGISIIEAEVRSQLLEAVAVGLLSENPAPTVTVPKAQNVSPTDRANRTLTGISFDGTLAGAIHKIILRGTIRI